MISGKDNRRFRVCPACLLPGSHVFVCGGGPLHNMAAATNNVEDNRVGPPSGSPGSPRPQRGTLKESPDRASSYVAIRRRIDQGSARMKMIRAGASHHDVVEPNSPTKNIEWICDRVRVRDVYQGHNIDLLEQGEGGGKGSGPSADSQRTDTTSDLRHGIEVLETQLAKRAERQGKIVVGNTTKGDVRKQRRSTIGRRFSKHSSKLLALQGGASEGDRGSMKRGASFRLPHGTGSSSSKTGQALLNVSPLGTGTKGGKIGHQGPQQASGARRHSVTTSGGHAPRRNSMHAPGTALLSKHDFLPQRGAIREGPESILVPDTQVSPIRPSGDAKAASAAKSPRERALRGGSKKKHNAQKELPAYVQYELKHQRVIASMERMKQEMAEEDAKRMKRKQQQSEDVTNPIVETAGRVLVPRASPGSLAALEHDGRGAPGSSGHVHADAISRTDSAAAAVGAPSTGPVPASNAAAKNALTEFHPSLDVAIHMRRTCTDFWESKDRMQGELEETLRGRDFDRHLQMQLKFKALDLTRRSGFGLMQDAPEIGDAESIVRNLNLRAEDIKLRQQISNYENAKWLHRILEVAKERRELDMPSQGELRFISALQELVGKGIAPDEEHFKYILLHALDREDHNLPGLQKLITILRDEVLKMDGKNYIQWLQGVNLPVPTSVVEKMESERGRGQRRGSVGSLMAAIAIGRLRRKAKASSRVAASMDKEASKSAVPPLPPGKDKGGHWASLLGAPSADVDASVKGDDDDEIEEVEVTTVDYSKFTARSLDSWGLEF